MKVVPINQQIRIVLGLFFLLLIVELLNLLSGRALTAWGILPRELSGIKGIVLAPFIHGSLWHFSANIVPLGVFAWLLLQYGMRRFILVNTMVILLSGVLVWLLGRHAMHIGASGVVYGYFGFLMLAGLLSGRFKLLVISAIVAILYGSLIFGVVPSRSYVSWESHLYGFLAGLLAAKLWAKSHR